MRITIVFEDGVMDTKENEEIFKLALDEAIKNAGEIFACDQEDMDDAMTWRSQFHRRTGNGDGCAHSYWTIDKHKLTPIGAERLERPYVPEKLYLEYFKWYFGRWIMAKRIIEIC